MRWAIVSIAAAIGSSAAAAEGPVTAWFAGPAADVADRLALLCADRQAEVVDHDDRHVSCRRQVTGGKGMLAQALLGNSASTAPVLNIRFALLKDGSATRVQATQWIELQMAGGQVRRTDLNNSKQRAQLEDALISAGGHNARPDEVQATDTTAP